jgi:acyl-CoA synthetase (AMP-forming)/AMP-acid ligase II
MRLSDHPREKIAYRMLASGQTVTYGELDDDSACGAQLFRHLGIGVGDGIAIWLPNHIEFLKITWAAQRAGIYYTPISTYFQTTEVSYILENSDAKLVITTRELLGRLTEIPFNIIVLLVDADCELSESWPRQREAQAPEPIDDEQEGSEMIYSSGTTGRPKGVRFPLSGSAYGNISATLQTRIDMHELSANTAYLSTAPFYHSAPLRYNMIVTRLGGTAFIMEKFDAESALRTIEAHKITHSQWVPTMFVRLLKLPDQTRQQYAINSLRYVIHAAAPCPVDVKRDMIKWFGPILYEYYSGTEANGFTAITTEEWLEHPGSVGRPVTGHVVILDDALKPLPAGQTGTVYFGGGNDFSYYKDPAKTATAKTQDGLSTLGDIGYLDEEGYLYLQDRKSFMVISGGVNIYPQEIENLLITHLSVTDVAVFGVPNQEFGEEVKAVIQTHEDGSKALAEELMTYCKQHLSAIKCPKSIDFIDDMPRHPTGKLYKQALKDRYWKLAES